jgi:hypothetical protein
MDSQNSSSPFLSTHLPITLLGVAFCLYFLTQLQEAGIESDGLAVQKTATTKLTDTLTKQIEKNGKELEDRKKLVAQSERIQEDFANESKTVKEKTTSSAQFEQLHTQIVEMNKALEQRKPMVEQSQKLQQQFTDFMKELDALAKGGDKDAQLVISTFGIQINDPAKEPEKKP